MRAIITELTDDPTDGTSFKGEGSVAKGGGTNTGKIKKVILPIRFAYDSAEILPSSREQLLNAGKAIRSSLLANVQIEIAAHTDSIGSEKSNQELSKKRAENVKQFLIGKFDIAEDRLIARGYGESQPIASNKTEEGRAKNRRVELIRR